jgi:hypothetical protein
MTGSFKYYVINLGGGYLELRSVKSKPIAIKSKITKKLPIRGKITVTQTFYVGGRVLGICKIIDVAGRWHWDTNIPLPKAYEITEIPKNLKDKLLKRCLR